MQLTEQERAVAAKLGRDSALYRALEERQRESRANMERAAAAGGSPGPAYYRGRVYGFYWAARLVETRDPYLVRRLTGDRDGAARQAEQESGDERFYQLGERDAYAEALRLLGEAGIGIPDAPALVGGKGGLLHTALYASAQVHYLSRLLAWRQRRAVDEEYHSGVWTALLWAAGEARQAQPAASLRAALEGQQGMAAKCAEAAARGERGDGDYLRGKLDGYDEALRLVAEAAAGAATPA